MVKAIDSKAPGLAQLSLHGGPHRQGQGQGPLPTMSKMATPSSPPAPPFPPPPF